MPTSAAQQDSATLERSQARAAPTEMRMTRFKFIADDLFGILPLAVGQLGGMIRDAVAEP